MPASPLGPAVDRHAVGGVVVAPLALGPHDPLGRRRLGNQERPGKLGSVGPAEQAEGEGDLRARGERRPQRNIRRARSRQHSKRDVFAALVTEGRSRPCSPNQLAPST